MQPRGTHILPLYANQNNRRSIASQTPSYLKLMYKSQIKELLFVLAQVQKTMLSLKEMKPEKNRK